MSKLIDELTSYFKTFYEYELLFDTDLFENGVLDSIGIIEFITFVQETYNVEIEVDEVTEENFRSVNNVASLIERKLV